MQQRLSAARQVVSRLPRRPIQIGVGLALIVSAAFMLMTNLKLLPGGGDAIGFQGPRSCSQRS